MSPRPFYITTTLPYVNADPHIGFALEIVQADAIARFRVLRGDEVFFNTGTDEHGLKIYRKALEEGRDVQAYVDDYATRFDKLREKLDLSYTNFIRTTDPHHVAAAQEFWRRCDANGHIYKKKYSVKYCVGCELEKTGSELVEGKCPIHPNLSIELIDEENYFFRFSAFQERLLALYDARPDFVVPASRLGEIRAFVANGLEDFSISRLAEKMPWGVPVLGDETQVMYVWFDALVNYISALGWPDGEKFPLFWPGLQVAGKDNLRQQSAMWQAMLMAADVPTSRQIFIHGFITSGGAKMSKSLGNVVNPFDLVDEFGTDAVRYFLLRHINPFEDSDYTRERFVEDYNAGLANGLGNLVSRVMKMAEEHLTRPPELPSEERVLFDDQIAPGFIDDLNTFQFNRAVDSIWHSITEVDSYIQTKQPFKIVKENPEEGQKEIAFLVQKLWNIAVLLEPIMPTTSRTIKDAVKANKKPENLFVRREV